MAFGSKRRCPHCGHPLDLDMKVVDQKFDVTIPVEPFIDYAAFASVATFWIETTE